METIFDNFEYMLNVLVGSACIGERAAPPITSQTAGAVNAAPAAGE